ncbi:MAG: DNA alkylation repair protein [Christensenellales bacterium]
MNGEDTANIRQRLMALADENYRIFSARLHCYQGKYVPKREMLGVRLPAVRKITRELAQKDWRRYTGCAGDAYFEEALLLGLLLGYAKAPMEELLDQVAAFIPEIDCWSVCDSLCGALKWVQTDMQRVWEFLQPYFDSAPTYSVRFAVVMLLCYYVVPEYIDLVLKRLVSIRHPDYYVKMAVAWTLCECYIQFPDKTGPFLHLEYLDMETCRMALQKITESLRVDDAVKNEMRKRKKELVKQEKRQSI